MLKRQLITTIFSIIISIPACFASYPNRYFEETFATAILLSDNESISLGIANFNPDALLSPSHDDFATSIKEGDSIKLRNELSVYSIPYTFVLDEKNSIWSDKVMVRFSYVAQKSSNYLLAGTQYQADENSDKIYALYSAYSHYTPLTEKWKLRLRLGAHLMHFKNQYSYNSSQSNEYKPLLDGIYYNVIANAAIIEPNAKLTYTYPTTWGKWQFSADMNYFIGSVYSGADSSSGAQPKGWRINNGLKLHFDINQSAMHAESLYFKFQRIDIQGDMVSPLQTDHYYEVGIGTLLDIHKYTSFAKNVGIGININRGSALSGGSIVFYFNEF